MKSALNRWYRELQNSTDRLIGETIDISKDKDSSVVLGESLDRGLDRGAKFVPRAHEIDIKHLCAVSDPVLLDCGLHVLHRYRPPAISRANLHKAGVHRDSVEPA